jgi:hypothetical protein
LATRWCDIQRFLDPHDLSVTIADLGSVLRSIPSQTLVEHVYDF